MTHSEAPRRSRWMIVASILGLLVAFAAGRWLVPSPPPSVAPVPVKVADQQAPPADVLVLDEHAVRMAAVTSVAAERRPAVRHLRTVGVIDVNEAGLAAIPSRVGGFLERLFVNQTGTVVRAGEHLAEIYSPDLIVAQQELLTARERPEGKVIAEAARARLRRFGIDETQISEIERSGMIQERLVLTSPIDGVVMEKMVVAQAPVEMGMVLYRIANLDTVWAQLAIHEQDLALVRPGQTVAIRADDGDASEMAGRVAFIEPMVDAMTRTVRARVVVPNPGHRLKPNMYVTAKIAVPLRNDGSNGPTGIEGKWTCSMHPDVLVDAAGPCPRCGMPLYLIPAVSAEDAAIDPLLVPRSAIFELGTRAIVWRELSPGSYQPTAVRTAGHAGEDTLIIEGLAEGDRVVVRGGFLLDSEAQIRGLPSLLNPNGGGAATGHQHGGGTRASGSAPTAPTPAPAPTPVPVPATGHQH